MLNLIDKVITLIDKAILVTGSTASWETKYDLVFSKQISRAVGDLLDELGLRLEYYDPDMSYEDDVVAYVNALSDLRPELVAVKTALEGIGLTAKAEDV